MKLLEILLKEELSPAEASKQLAQLILQNPDKKVKVPSGADMYNKDLLLKLGNRLGFEGSEEDIIAKVIESDLIKNKDKYASIDSVGENPDGKLQVMVTQVAPPFDPRQGRGPRPGDNFTGD